MAVWRVRRYVNGIWNGAPPVFVEAESSREAVERVLGVPMLRTSGDGHYDAAAWTAGTIPSPDYFEIAKYCRRDR